MPGYASRVLPVDLPEGWFAFNPSIARHDGRLVMLVRAANYSTPGWAIAPGDTKYRSRTLAVEVAPDGTFPQPPFALDDLTADEGHRDDLIEGLEDLRAISLGDSLLATGSLMRRIPGGRNVCLGLFDVDLAARTIANPRWLSDGSSGVPEKNWMPAVADGNLLLVHSCGPTAVLACDPATGRLSLAALHDAPAIAAGFRGGTPLVPHDGGWLALVHEAADWDWQAGHRTYLHRVVGFDASLRITHASHPFRFEGENLEFAAGMVVEGGEALVSFGVGDREARLATVPLAALTGVLRPVSGIVPAVPAPSPPLPGLRWVLRQWMWDSPPAGGSGLPASWQEVLDAPAFVINLDRMPERAGPAVERIVEAGYADVRRVRAVDGQEPGELAAGWALLGNPPFADDGFRLADFPGHQGCFLSHVGIWRMMIDRGLPFATVFEDDVRFHRRWHALAPDRFASTPGDVDVVWLSAGIHVGDASDDGVLEVPVGGLAGYMLTASGAERLLRCVLDRPEGVTVIDQATQRCQRRMLAGESPPDLRWRVWSGLSAPDPPYGPLRRGDRIENAGLVHHGFSGSSTGGLGTPARSPRPPVAPDAEPRREDPRERAQEQLVSVRMPGGEVTVRRPRAVPEFWDWLAGGAWEPCTLAMLRDQVRPGSVFVDLGAWVGPTTLAAASLGADVVAYECDPAALEDLERNVALNPGLSPRIRVVPAAIGDGNGRLRLFSTTLGNTETSVFGEVERAGHRVVQGIALEAAMVDAADAFRDGGWLGRPDALVKMDIEGAEYRVLDRLGAAVAEARCRFIVSFHGHNIVRDTPGETVRARSDAAARWAAQFAAFDWLVCTDLGLATAQRETLLDQAARDPERLPPILFVPRDRDRPGEG